MYNELSVALRETFKKKKELIRTPDKFIEEVRCSFSASSSLPEKTYITLQNALANKIILESMLIIDNVQDWVHKAELVEKIYLRSFLRILEEDMDMKTDTAMFTVIPNLFHILELCVNPQKENSEIVITISDCAEVKNGSKKNVIATENEKQLLREERRKQKYLEEQIKRNKPNRVSERIVNWIMVAIFIAFCGVFLFSVLNPPDTPIKMLYSFLSLTLAGVAAFFTKIIKSMGEMFGKHVTREEDVFIQIMGIDKKDSNQDESE